MNTPIDLFGVDLLERLEKYKINTDITDRWQHEEHRKDAKKLANEIETIDWMFADDSFNFKFGGDGDNGETLIYILDILLDLRDAEKA